MEEITRNNENIVVDMIKDILSIDNQQAFKILNRSHENNKYRASKTRINNIEICNINSGVIALPFSIDSIELVTKISKVSEVYIISDGKSNTHFDSKNINIITTEDIIRGNFQKEIIVIFSDLYWGADKAKESVTFFEKEAQFSMLEYLICVKYDLDLFLVNDKADSFSLSKCNLLSPQQVSQSIATSIEQYILTNFEKIIDWSIYLSKFDETIESMKKITRLAYEGFLFSKMHTNKCINEQTLQQLVNGD